MKTTFINKKNNYSDNDNNLNTFKLNYPKKNTYSKFTIKTTDNLNYHADGFKKKGFIDGLIDGIKASTPWLNNNKKITLTTPFECIEIDKPNYSYSYISPEMLNLEWNKASTKLINTLYGIKEKSYDFYIGDLPVKVFGNYIQIGFDIIPTFTNSNFFTSFDNKKTITLYEVVTTINSIELEVAA